MKYFHLLIIICLFGCSSKEKQPELDYVKIDILPIQHYIPSSITIDFKSKTVTFSDLSQLEIIPEDCAFTLDKFEPNVKFNFIRLNEEEFNDLRKILNINFLQSIKKKAHQDLYNEGVWFRISIANNNEIYTSENFLILEKSDEIKISKILKIIKKHTRSEHNKEYIDYISFFIE